jgi:hypothetical protein
VGEWDVGIVDSVGGYSSGKYILARLDQGYVIVQIIFCINIHINDVVAQAVQEIDGSRRCCAVEVRTTEVRREEAE